MNESTLCRFWAKVEPEPNSGCWLWSGAISRRNGYGQLSVNNRAASAHRLSYTHFVAHIPQGLFVLHRCDVRVCVNPAHLFVGTAAENTQDMIRKGRQVLVQGAQHNSARLTDITARELWERLVAGASDQDLAARFGVALSTVNNFRNGYTWTHLTGLPRRRRRLGRLV